MNSHSCESAQCNKRLHYLYSWENMGLCYFIFVSLSKKEKIMKRALLTFGHQFSATSVYERGDSLR